MHVTIGGDSIAELDIRSTIVTAWESQWLEHAEHVASEMAENIDVLAMDRISQKLTSRENDRERVISASASSKIPQLYGQTGTGLKFV